MAEDRKFEFRDGKFYNRVSGEAIPDNEPVIIFRARDKHALPILLYYRSLISDPHHYQAVTDRINDFEEFARHNDRREPGTTHHIVLNSERD